MFKKHIKVLGKHMKGTIIGGFFFTSKTLTAEEKYSPRMIEEIIVELQAIKKEMEKNIDED